MANTNVVLWDWNGTLLDDRDFTLGCLNALLEEFGYPQRYGVAEYLELFDFPIEDYYKKAGFDFTLHPYPVLAERFMAMYNPNAHRCGLMPDARQTLQALRQTGLQQVILSATRRDTLRLQVEQQQLSGCFDELIGLGDIYGKSKVQAGLDWMARTGVDPHTAVMIGDTLHDAEVARALGARCILVTTGHHSRRRLETAGCPVADRLSEIPALL